MLSQGLLKGLTQICGREGVLTSAEELLCYSYDASPTPRMLPQVVVLPRSTPEVIEVVRLAWEAGLAIVPRGAGTGLSGGAVPVKEGLVLALTRMNHILELDAPNLTAIVEPGVVTSQFHRAVERLGFFYPPDPASANSCTLGGNVATNAGGLRALKYGVTRNYVLGLEAILADGRVLETGGQTMKEVTGYDLTRLLIGSEGTLGIITKLSLKLIPLPPAKKTLLVSFRRAEEAVAIVSTLLSHHLLPTTLEFMDSMTLRCVEHYKSVGLPQEAEAVLLIEVDGSSTAVAEEAEAIARLCTRSGAVEVRLAQDAAQAEELVNARRSVLPALAQLRPTVLIEDATVPPSRLVEVVEGVRRIGNKYQIQAGTYGHAGDGNLHPYFLCSENDAQEMARVEKAVAEVVELALKLGGTVSGEHGIGQLKASFLPWKVKPVALEVMKGIKHLLDPKNILNPGKLFHD